MRGPGLVYIFKQGGHVCDHWRPGWSSGMQLGACQSVETGQTTRLHMHVCSHAFGHIMSASHMTKPSKSRGWHMQYSWERPTNMDLAMPWMLIRDNSDSTMGRCIDQCHAYQGSVQGSASDPDDNEHRVRGSYGDADGGGKRYAMK